MSYRLKIKEPLAEGIRRIVLEQIEIAESELRGNTDAAAGVHNARRALKRLRALLRLVRPGLDAASYRRQALRFAETGRLLAGARDRHVMRQTLAKLSTSSTLPESLVSSLEALLAPATAAADDTADPREAAASNLSAARKAVAGNALAGLERAHIFEGAEIVYRKARKLHRHCVTGDAVDEDFHALRKCVQQHWRHMQLLSRAWPEALTARAEEAKALSQLLGEDHDLHILRSFAQAHSEALSSEDLAALRQATVDAQSALRTRALLHADRLFSERPRDLSARLRSYWSAAQGLTALKASDDAADDAPSPKPRALKPRVHRQPAAKRAKPAAVRTPRSAPRRAP